jgi:hypothetical protein
VKAVATIVTLFVVLACLAFFATRRPFPPDTTPEGAYLRIAKSIGEGKPQDMFAYLERDAQWACYTLRDMRKKAYDRIEATYPEPLRGETLGAYGSIAKAPDGSDVFALLAKERGWTTRLRRDLSGVAKVETNQERATVETANRTRYPFRRRENGIWGLTIFTAELVAESEKAARDLAVIEKAAADYERAAGRSGSDGGANAAAP